MSLPTNRQANAAVRSARDWLLEVDLQEGGENQRYLEALLDAGVISAMERDYPGGWTAWWLRTIGHPLRP